MHDSAGRARGPDRKPVSTRRPCRPTDLETTAPTQDAAAPRAPPQTFHLGRHGTRGVPRRGSAPGRAASGAAQTTWEREQQTKKQATTPPPCCCRAAVLCQRTHGTAPARQGDPGSSPPGGEPLRLTFATASGENTNQPVRRQRNPPIREGQGNTFIVRKASVPFREGKPSAPASSGMPAPCPGSSKNSHALWWLRVYYEYHAHRGQRVTENREVRLHAVQGA